MKFDKTLSENFYRGIFALALAILCAVAGYAAPLEMTDPETVFEVAADGNRVWAGYNGRLYYSTDYGLYWTCFDQFNGFGRGAVSAITMTDSECWAATYHDTLINGVTVFVNGGLFKSDLDLIDWTKLDIPAQYHPGNIIYDIDIGLDEVWTANWWRSLSKSTDGGLNWLMVVPDTGLYAPTERLHQRVFAVSRRGSEIWSGSQSGINLSLDNGLTWQNLIYSAEESSIVGDKVVAIEFRDFTGGTEIWAATWSNYGPGQSNGVSISDDSGKTWRSVLPEEQAWNFLFHDNDIFVACNSGLWFSENDGNSFSNITSGSLPAGIEVYDVDITDDSTLWIGTSSGLYKGNYQGTSWAGVTFIILDADDDRINKPDKFILETNYPNPFNPATVIPFNLEKSAEVRLQVFDILGRLQKTLVSGRLRPGRHQYLWDGTDNRGQAVSGGIYFYRLYDGESAHTRKMLLLK